MHSHAMTLLVQPIGVRTTAGAGSRPGARHGGRPGAAPAPRACSRSEPRLGAEATRARSVRARVFARRASPREIRPVHRLGDHARLVSPQHAARGPSAAHAASNRDDDKDASSSSPSGTSGVGEDAASGESASTGAGPARAPRTTRKPRMINPPRRRRSARRRRRAARPRASYATTTRASGGRPRISTRWGARAISPRGSGSSSSPCACSPWA